MIRPPRTLLVLLTLIGAMGAFSPGALAAEEPPVVKALLDGVALTAAARPTYGSLEVAGDGTITLANLALTLAGEDDADSAISYEIEKLTLAEVKEISSGLFEIGRAEWAGLTLKLGDSPLAAVPLINGRSVYVQALSDPPTLMEKMRASNLLAREFAMPEAIVLFGGQSITVEKLHWTWDGDPATGAGVSQFELARINVPGTLMGDEEADNPLAAAGYDKLELSLTGKGLTTYDNEAFGFDFEVSINGVDIGKLIVNLAADGVPLALFGALEVAEADPDKVMALVQGINLRRAKIRFEDGSLTGRIIALMAEAQGVGEAAFVADTSAAVEAGLADLGDKDLAGQATAAVNAFLSDPKALTLSLNPAEPVRVEDVMAAAEDAAAVIRQLGMSITAND